MVLYKSCFIVIIIITIIIVIKLYALTSLSCSCVCVCVCVSRIVFWWVQWTMCCPVSMLRYVSLRAVGWRPSVADWGGGMSAGCRPWAQLFTDTGNGWPHIALRYH